MPFPDDQLEQMHRVDGQSLPVVFSNESMSKYTCHIKGGNVAGNCSGTWATTQIDKHMIEKHQLCCYNHALSKNKILFRCPFGCRCFFQVDQVAGFITREQCLLHLERFHQGETSYQSKVTEVKAMLVQTRLKIKQAFANRNNKLAHYEELESEYRTSKHELNLALIKLNAHEEFIAGCSESIQEQIRNRINLDVAEYHALNAAIQ